MSILKNVFMLVVLSISININSYAQIPFEMINGIPTFKDVNNKVQYSFDSGAYTTMIFSENGLNYCQPTFLRYTLAYNALGKFFLKQKKRLKININGIGNINTIATKDIKTGICNDDIMFGIDIMHGKVLHFDFKNKLFYYLDKLPDGLNGFIHVPIEKPHKKEYSLPLIINSVKDDYKIDLGFSGTLITNQKTYFNRETSFDVIINAFGNDYTKEIQVDTNSTIEFEKTEIKLKTNLLYADGISNQLIGMEFFSSFDEVIFDFKNLAIYFKNYNDILNNTNSSIKIVKSADSDYKVNVISHSSKYYQKGIRLNQKLKVKHEELAALLSNADECKHYIIIAEWLQTHELEALFEVL